MKGQVYLHSMPGRYETWYQFQVAAANASVQGIVCLADDTEVATKSLSYAKALTSEFPYALHRFPIKDYGVPEDLDDLAKFVDHVADRVRAGERLLVHCGAGIGRTGMFASCLLMVLGSALEEALATVAAAGSKPETHEQGRLVRRFAEARGT